MRAPLTIGLLSCALAIGCAAHAQSLLDEAHRSHDIAGDPETDGGLVIVEGYLDGAQTGTGFGEDYLVGIPRGIASGGPRPLLLAWHGFGSPPRSILRDSDYAAECAARGWFLLAPRGLDDKSFGFPPAQRNVLAVLERVLSEHSIDRERLYAVGWSMGAQSALCFAARHRDDARARFAAVAALQGPHDVLDTYARENAALRAWLERLFGAAPFLDARPYLRTSCVRLDATRSTASVDPSYALHLLDLPVLLVHALDDPLAYLRAQNEALAATLRSRGAPVNEWRVRGIVPAHDWRVASAEAICNWLAAHEARESASRFELVSDGEASRGGVRLHPAGNAAFATAVVSREGSAWKLTRLCDAAEVEIDAGEIGARAGGSLCIGLFRGSGSAELLRVRGLLGAPLAVRRGSRTLRELEWSAEEGLRLEVRGAPTRWRIELADPGAR